MPASQKSQYTLSRMSFFTVVLDSEFHNFKDMPFPGNKREFFNLFFYSRLHSRLLKHHFGGIIFLSLSIDPCHCFLIEYFKT